MSRIFQQNPDLMKPREAAEVFGVHIKTLRRWALDGHLNVIKLPGGQCRYFRSEVSDLAQVAPRAA